MNKNIKVTAIEHHRNGISGEPFYIVLFDNGKAKMVGIVFDDPKYVAVLDVNLLAAGEIRFFHNSWRGDDFEPDLRNAIKEWESRDRDI